MKSCLIINNREYIPIERLTDLSKRIKIHWYQKTIDIIPIDKLSGKYPDINFLITTYANLSAGNLKKFKKLELIIATTTAVEYIDLNYCEKNGITVCNTPFYTNTTIAEFVFALILNISRQVLQVDKAIRSGDFNCFDFCGIELSEKTLGIIGFGNIGSSVANIANGFGMKVVFYNRGKKNSQDSKSVNLRTLLSQSDFIVLCVPLNSASHHLIGQNEFDLMKSTAILISISPAEVIEKKYLFKALKSKKIFGAGIDLSNQDTSYLDIPNLLITPRRAWYTKDCFNRRISKWHCTFKSYLEGSPINTIKIPV